MLIYEDVSQDPSARGRSGLDPALFDTLGVLGFDLVGWIMARPTAALEGARFTILTAVLASRDGRTLATLARAGDIEDISFATLFEDGSVVQNGRKPSKGWWYLRWGLHVPPAHDYALAYVDAALPELLSLHEARVATEELCGRKVVAAHGLHTHLAIRRRYRQIADARMQRQQAIAKAMGTVAAVASMAGLTGALAAYRPAVEVVAVAALLGLAASFVLGFGAFLGALYFVAPILARGAKAPARRPASELLALAREVRMAWLPPLGAESATSPDAPLPVPLSVDELARLKRRDLVLSLALGSVFPIVALGAVGAVGDAGIWIAIAVTNLAGGAVLLATKKSPLEHARQRLVPALAAAEVSCANGACGIPARWRPYLGLGIGLSSAFVAHKGIAAGVHPAPAWLFLELVVIAAVILASTAARVKKRHRRVVAA